MVSDDIGGYGWGEEVVAGVACMESLAEGGGGDIFVDGVEEVDAGELGGCEMEWGEVFEGEAGAADDDPLGEGEESLGLAPLGEGEEAVGTDEGEEGGVGLLVLELLEGVDGVVGGVVEVRCVEVGGGEAWVGGDGELGHGEAVGKGCGFGEGLERLATGGGEEDGVEMKGIGCGGGDGEVAAVDGVEGTAEEGYAHSPLW